MLLIVVGWILHPRGSTLAKRYFILHATMCIIRSIAITITTIPSPNPGCGITSTLVRDENEIFPLRSFALTIAAVGLTPLVQLIFPHTSEWNAFKGTTCCDIIISGHTCALTIALSCVFFTYKDIRMRFFASALYVLGLLSCISPYRHYTIDVFLTLIIAFLVVIHFTNYIIITPSPIQKFIEGEDIPAQSLSFPQLFSTSPLLLKLWPKKRYTGV